MYTQSNSINNISINYDNGIHESNPRRKDPKINNLMKHATESLGQLIQQSPKDAVNVLLNILPGKTINQNRIIESLVVRYLDDMDMRGATLTDTLSEGVMSGELRPKVFASAHPWIAAGSYCVPIFIVNNEKYILFEHNYRKDSDKPILRFPSGYMHPRQPPQRLSNTANHFYDSNDDAEQMLYLSQNHKRMTLEQSREKMRFYYRNLNANEPNKITQTYDKTLSDAAQRELFEEVGLEVEKDDIYCIQVSQGGYNGLVPVLEGEFLIHNNLDQLPSLKPDGKEVDDAFFVPLSDLEETEDGYQYNDIEKAIIYIIPSKEKELLKKSLKTIENITSNH